MTVVRRIARPLLAPMFVDGGLDSSGTRPQGQAGRAGGREDRSGARPARRPRDAGPGQRRGHDGAGALFATGRLPRTARTVLAATLVPTTVAGHPFWEEDDPAGASSGCTSSRTSACSAACSSPSSTPRASPAWATAPTVRRQRQARRRPDQPGGAARRARRPPRGQARRRARRSMPSADWTAPTATAPVDARVVLPGSKSLTNRYLVLAALARRPRLRRPLRSRDTQLMADACARSAPHRGRRPGRSTGSSPPARCAAASTSTAGWPARHALPAAGRGARRRRRSASTATRRRGCDPWPRCSARCAPSASRSTTAAAARCRSPCAGPARSAAAP